MSSTSPAIATANSLEAGTLAPFLISSVIAGLLILYWAFFSSTLAGFIVSKILSYFARRQGARIRVDSVNLAPLSGTIVIKGLYFINNDICVKAVDGFIRIRWWLQQSKQNFEDSRSCRIEIELNGLDVQVFNYSGRYAQLRNALLKTRLDPAGVIDDDQSIRIADPIPIDEFQPNFLIRFSPVVKVVVHRGSVLVGNPLIQSVFVCSFHSAHVKYTVTDPTYPGLDYCQTKVRTELTNVTCRIAENAMYLPKNPLDEENVPDNPFLSNGFEYWLSKFNFKFAKSFFGFKAENTQKSEDKQRETSKDSKDDNGSFNKSNNHDRISTDGNQKSLKADSKTQEKLPSPRTSTEDFKIPELKIPKWKSIRHLQDAMLQGPPLILLASITVDYFADSPGPVLASSYDSKIQEVAVERAATEITISPQAHVPKPAEVEMQEVKSSNDQDLNPKTHQKKKKDKRNGSTGPTTNEGKERKKERSHNVSFQNQSAEVEVEQDDGEEDEENLPPPAPEWGITAIASTTTAAYGPEANRLRFILQSFFIPAIPPTPVVTPYRQYSKFSVDISFIDKFNLRIPFVSETAALLRQQMLQKQSTEQQQQLKSGPPEANTANKTNDSCNNPTSPSVDPMLDPDQSDKPIAPLPVSSRQATKKSKKTTHEEDEGHRKKIQTLTSSFTKDWFEVAGQNLTFHYDLPSQPNAPNVMYVEFDALQTSPVEEGGSVHIPIDQGKDSDSTSSTLLEGDNKVPRVSFRCNFTDKAFVEVRKFRVDVQIIPSTTPLEPSTWNLSVSVANPDLFLLRDHIDGMVRMASDFAFPASQFVPSSYSDMISSFKPTNYNVNVNFEENFGIYFNTNEGNVIWDITSLDRNNFYCLNGESLEGIIQMDFTTFRQDRTVVKFAMSAQDIMLDAIHPEKSTFRQLWTSTSDQDLYSNFISSKSIRVNGNFDYATGSDQVFFNLNNLASSPPSPLNLSSIPNDSLSVKVDTSDVKFILFGCHLNMFLRFLENYTGKYSKSTKGHEPSFQTKSAGKSSNNTIPISKAQGISDYLVKSDVIQGKAGGRVVRAAFKPPQTRSLGLDIQVNVNRAVAILPLNLYSCNEFIEATSKKVQVSVSNGPDTLIAVRTAPIKAWLPSLSCSILPQPIAMMDGFSLEIFSKNGTVWALDTSNQISPVDVAAQMDYRFTIKVWLGNARLSAEPLQVLRTMDGVLNLLYSIFNIDNRPDAIVPIKTENDRFGHKTVMVSLKSVQGHLWTTGGVVQAKLPQGFKLCMDNLQAPTAAGFLRFRIPHGHFSILTPSYHSLSTTNPGPVIPEMEDWAEAFAVQLPLLIVRSVDGLVDASKSLHMEQLEYLRIMDASRGKSSIYLWDSPEIHIWGDPLNRPWIRDFFDELPIPIPSSITKQGFPSDNYTSASPSFGKSVHDIGLAQSSSIQPSAPKERVDPSHLPHVPGLSMSSGSNPIIPLPLTAKLSRKLAKSEKPRQYRAKTIEVTGTPADSSITPSTETPQDQLSNAADEFVDAEGGDEELDDNDEDSDFLSAHSVTGSEASEIVTAEKDSTPAESKPPIVPKLGLASRSSIPKIVLPINIESGDTKASQSKSPPPKPKEKHPAVVPADCFLDHYAFEPFIDNHLHSSSSVGSFHQSRESYFQVPYTDEDLVSMAERHNVLAPSPTSKLKKSQQEDQETKKNEDPNKRAYSDEDWEQNKCSALLLHTKSPIKGHLTPNGLAVIGGIIYNISRELKTVETIFDRFQQTLVRQLVASSNQTGLLQHKAMFVHIVGIQLNLLQNNVGVKYTSYVTSFSLKDVILAQRTASEKIHPVAYANERHELPAVIVDHRSKDISFKIGSSSLIIRRLAESFCKFNLKRYGYPVPENDSMANPTQDTHQQHQQTFSQDTPRSSEVKEAKISSTHIPSPSTSAPSGAVPSDNTIIFDAKLTSPLKVLHRFVAPSYSSTREAATYVTVGQVVGHFQQHIGSCIVQILRGWLPSAKLVGTSTKDLVKSMDLAYYILFETLVRLRDVEIAHSPYDAFGIQSEAQRVAWILIYLARMRMASASTNNQPSFGFGYETVRRIDSASTFGLFHPFSKVSLEHLMMNESISDLSTRKLCTLMVQSIDLDFVLHKMLKTDPDLIAAHFLGTDMLMKRSQSTREKFDVRITGLSMKCVDKVQKSSAEKSDCCSLDLLPVEVTAMTKSNTRIPRDSKQQQSQTAASASSQRRQPSLSSSKNPITRSDELNASSSDYLTGTFQRYAKTTYPVTTAETQFLANSKGVNILIVPNAAAIFDELLTEWALTSKELDHYELPHDIAHHTQPRKLTPSFMFDSTRFSVLEQMFEHSSLTEHPNKDKHAISGHLVSDAFALRAASQHGVIALDIPETTLTISSLPSPADGSRSSSHSIMIRLPDLTFAAAIERQTNKNPFGANLNKVPIALVLKHLSICANFTPSGFDGRASNTSTIRSSNKYNSASGIDIGQHGATSGAEGASPTLTTERQAYDALDVIIILKSAHLPFKIPHPQHAQSFLNEWYVPATSTSAGSAFSSSDNATSNLQKSSSAYVGARPHTSSRVQDPLVQKGEMQVIGRKIHAAFHGHFESISVVMTQLPHVPVKYEIPEVFILSRHRGNEHGLRFSLKSHSISFDPKGTVETGQSTPLSARTATAPLSTEARPTENIEFVTKKVTRLELPPIRLEAALKSFDVHSEMDRVVLELSQSLIAKPKPDMHHDIRCKLSIRYIQNILKADALKNILLFEATMRREFAQVVAVWEDMIKQNKRTSLKTSTISPPPAATLTPSGATTATRKDANDSEYNPFEFLKKFPNVRWMFNLDWKGLEFQVRSPPATIMLYTGHLKATMSNLTPKLPKHYRNIHDTLKSSKRRKKKSHSARPSNVENAHLGQPHRKSDSMLQNVTGNPFNVQVSLSNISFALCPPSTHASLYDEETGAVDSAQLNLWAGMITNILVQTYPDESFTFKYSSTGNQRGSFRAVWFLLDGTRVLAQPWVGEKALLMFLFFRDYYQTISKDKIHSATPTAATTAKSPATKNPESPNSSALAIEGTNVSLFVKVGTIVLLVPCNVISQPKQVVAAQKGIFLDADFSTALLIRLESFTLSGSSRSTNQARLKFKGNLKPKKTQILANAVVKGLVVGFVAIDFENQVVSLENASLYNPPTINLAFISEADCKFSFMKESRPKITSTFLSSSSNHHSSHHHDYGPSSIRGAIEAETAGLVFKLNSKLYSHVAVLAKSIEIGQQQFVNLMGELHKDAAEASSAQKLRHQQSQPQLRRPRGGTISLRQGSVLLDHIAILPPVSSQSSGLIASQEGSGSATSGEHSSFELDISLTTKAGSIEIYSLVSITKVDVSTVKTLRKGGKGTTGAGATNLPILLDTSVQASEELFASESTAIGTKPSSFKLPPLVPLTRSEAPSGSMLVAIPMPQVICSFSSRFNAPDHNPQTSPSNSASPKTPHSSVTDQPVPRHNEGKGVSSNILTLVIENMDCSVTPDFVIFYHELLAQISIVKILLVDARPNNDARETLLASASSIADATLQSSESINRNQDNISDSKLRKDKHAPTPPKDFESNEIGVPSTGDNTTAVKAIQRTFWTIYIRIKESSLVLTSSPYSETTCSFKTGDIVLLYQGSEVSNQSDTSTTTASLHGNVKLKKPHQSTSSPPIASSHATKNSSTSFQQTVMLQVSSLTLIMEHPHLEKDNSLAVIQLGLIRLHGSHIDNSGEIGNPNPLTVMLLVSSMGSFFSVRHLQEIILFANVWKQGITLSHFSDGNNSNTYSNGSNLTHIHIQSNGESGEEEAAAEPNQGASGGNDSSTEGSPITASASNASSVANPKVGMISLLLEDSAILLNAEIKCISLSADLGPSLAAVAFSVDYILGSLSAPGRSPIDPFEELFDLVLEIGEVESNFSGALDGEIKIPVLSLRGSRILYPSPSSTVNLDQIEVDPEDEIQPSFPNDINFNSSSGSVPNKSAKKTKSNLVGRNIWNMDFSPASVKLNYSMSPVLLIQSGAIGFSAKDSWKEKEESSGPSDDESGAEAPLSSSPPSSKWHPSSDLEISFEKMELYISSETISIPVTFAKRLLDSIKKSNSKALSQLKSMEQLLVVRKELNKMRHKAGMGGRPLERLQQIRREKQNLAAHNPFSISGIVLPKYDIKSGGTPSYKNSGKKPATSAEPTQSAKPSTLIPVTGRVTLVGKYLNIRLYGYSLRDPSWFDVSMSNYQISLNQQIQYKWKRQPTVPSTSTLTFISKSPPPLYNAATAKLPVLSRSFSRDQLSGSTGSVRNPSLDSSHQLQSSFVEEPYSVDRELSVVVGSAFLSKMSENSRRNQDRSVMQTSEGQIAEHVLVIPAITLVEFSSQEIGSLDVDVYFVTQFKEAIRVSIRLGLYTELKDTVSLYKRVIQSSKDTSAAMLRTAASSLKLEKDAIGSDKSGLSNSRKRRIPNVTDTSSTFPPASINPNKPSSSFVVTANTSDAISAQSNDQQQGKNGNTTKSSAPAAPSSEKGESTQNRNFIVKKFDFDPSVDVLGDFTPKIATVLGWLGIKDGQKTIPSSVHAVTDILELVLHHVNQSSKLITKQRQRKFR